MDLVFEGINGSGKSTIVAALGDRLNHLGISTFSINDHKSTTADKIKKINIFREEFLDDFILETVLVACERRCDLASRLLHPEEIGLFERGLPSLLAFGASRGLQQDQILPLKSIIMPDYPTENWVLVDVDAQTAAQRNRTKNRHRFERYSIEWYNRLRKHYLTLAAQNENHCLIVDGTREVDHIVDQIINEFF